MDRLSGMVLIKMEVLENSITLYFQGMGSPIGFSTHDKGYEKFLTLKVGRYYIPIVDADNKIIDFEL